MESFLLQLVLVVLHKRHLCLQAVFPSQYVLSEYLNMTIPLKASVDLAIAPALGPDAKVLDRGQ